jgi:hypothetical protein
VMAQRNRGSPHAFQEALDALDKKRVEVAEAMLDLDDKVAY